MIYVDESHQIMFEFFSKTCQNLRGFFYFPDGKFPPEPHAHASACFPQLPADPCKKPQQAMWPASCLAAPVAITVCQCAKAPQFQARQPKSLLCSLCCGSWTHSTQLPAGVTKNRHMHLKIRKIQNY